MHYKTSAPYFPYWYGLQCLLPETHLPGYLYVGLRYGMSSFTYDASGPEHDRPKLRRTYNSSFADLGCKEQCQLAEGAGIKVKYTRFHMGWAVRYKMRMSVDSHEKL